MRRALVLLCFAALAATSCGALADDTAATVEGREISTSLIDSMVTDDALVEILGFEAPDGESVLPGSSARTALDLALEGQALLAEAERQEIEVEADVELLEEQLASTGVSADDLDAEVRDFLALYVGASSVLNEAAQDPEPYSDQELRAVYDALPPESWNRTCVDVVSATEEQQDEVEAVAAELEPGELLTVVEDVPEAAVEIDSSERCFTGAELAVDSGTAPVEFLEAVAEATEGEVVGPITFESSQGTALLWLEVRSSGTLSFEDAREELDQLATDSPLAMSIFTTAEVNPRYGEGVELEVTTGSTGTAVLVATVARPTAPAPVVPDLTVPVAPDDTGATEPTTATP